MKIEYCSYESELIDNIDGGKIHIFEKSGDKDLASSRYRVKLFEKQALLMGFNSFKESLYLDSKISIKEEKQVIAFYRSLSAENKKRLKIEGYYDSIDIAANFLNFFKLLREYRVEGIENLRPWQDRTYSIFKDIAKDYKWFLDKKGYTDPTFIIEDKNINVGMYSEYSEIIIYNKLYFTPREKYLIERLEEGGYSITLKLQIEKGDFNEEKLALEKVSYIPKPGQKLDVYRANDSFTMLIKTLEIADKESKDIDGDRSNITIYDGNHERNKYNNYFKEELKLSELGVFKVLEGIHTLISNVVVERKRFSGKKTVKENLRSHLLISVASLVEVGLSSDFSRYMNIAREELVEIKGLVGRGYKYVTYEYLYSRLDSFEDEKKNKGVMGLLKLVTKVIEWYSYENLEDWCGELEFSKDMIDEFSIADQIDEANKYYEALSEVRVIEELDLIDQIDGRSNWKGFFDFNVSEGLLRLIMKYFRFKSVETGGDKFSKGSLDDISTSSRDTLILMNISDIYLPKGGESTFLLTETQKKDLGIKNNDDTRLMEKYNILRAIMTSIKVDILCVENQGENTSLSPFIEEIVEDNNKLILDIESYQEISQVVVESRGRLDIVGSENKLLEDKKEILDKKSISAYMCEEMFNCRYKMYLRYIDRIASEDLEVDEGLTRREYGNLSHGIFEEVLNRYGSNLSLFENGDIEIGQVGEIIKELISKDNRNLRLPTLNSKYYEEILYMNIARSVKVFFKEMSIKLKGESVKKIRIEERKSAPIIDGLEQVAKADLIIETDRDTHIIDFKTGDSINRQLDYYGILYTGEADKAKKYIYSVDKNILKSSDVKMTKEQLIKEAYDLLGSSEYKRTPSSRCSRCEYYDICRVDRYREEQ